MGTRFAPSYATLVLAYLEEILYRKVEIEFDKESQFISKKTGNGFWITVSFFGQKEKTI